MNKFVKISFCLLLALALCFGDFLPLLCNADISAFAASETETPVEQSEGVVRPEEIDEGLSVNSLDDIRGRRVTVRQPVMEILRDDIVRQPAEVMSDVYEMRDLETGEIMHQLAKINFAADPQLEAGNKDHPMYPMRGLDRTPKDDDGNIGEQKYFSEFTKYMLLRQAYYFNTHVNEIVNGGQLKKHPAADYIYGKIPDDAKAVSMRIVTDPIYRSPMTTGLYLVAGEEVTVKIKGLKAGETVTLYTHHQDTMGYLGYNENGGGFGKMEDYLGYWDDKIVAEARRAESAGQQPDFDKFNYGLHGQWQWQNQKVPCMGTTFNIVGTGKETEVKIGSMYGGPLYVKPTSDAVEMEITGAVLTPHFVLGVTTVEEFEKELSNAPGLIATLDVENGQLIGPAEDMRNCDDIEKLAYFWHSVFAIDISLNGREYNYNMTMCYDLHVPAGEAVALNSNFCAQPEYWFPICMNYETLTTKGNWGTFHELGHVQAKTHGVNWGFCDGDGEVWNNTLILLIYSMLCNMDSRVVSVEHGEYVHPYTAVERSQKITQQYKDKETGQMRDIVDYGQINDGNGAHFDQLSMYATLLHSFGSDKFVDMFYTYKMNPAYCSNKRADFVYRIGVVDRVNILDWVNDNYFARITEDMFTDSQLEFLNNLPDFVPVAYRWANGIDGHETARKYDVDGKFPTVFDLSGDNISSPEEVEIVAVTDALYGETDYDEISQKVTYTPPATATEYDRFDIIVKTKGGRRVTLNVNMRLVYRGLYGEVWDLGSKTDWSGRNPTLSEAKNFAQSKPHDYTLTSSSAGVEFNRQNIEYLHLRFKYRAGASGSYGFYVKADDVAEVRFYKGNDKGELIGTVSVPHDTTSFTAYPHIETSLTAGEIVYVDCDLVNWGGKGHLTVGVRQPDSENIVALPSSQLISAGVDESELTAVDGFKGWQPRFVDSIKNATIDYKIDRDGWTVLATPESENGSGGDNLVDGDESTIFHSKYNGKKAELPHVFVIDTTADQTFNFFEFVRRTNGNDKLLKFALYSCTESDYVNAAQGAVADTNGWTKLFDGSSSNVNAARQRISFPRTQLRYFKFVVTDNNGGHTVLKEIYAGVESQLNQTVKPSNYMTDNSGFTENSANGKLSSTEQGAQFAFEFLGSGFEIFADTDPSYGTASVTVDEELKGKIVLNDQPLFNKQVFDSEELATSLHKVVVTVLDDKPFNISFLNVKYGTPVAADEYPALKDDNGNEDYGDTDVARQFTKEWKTFVKDYKTLTSIKFLTQAPQGYDDTYVRIDTYIRLYRKDDKIAFVYPGKILAPIECGSLFSSCEKLSELVLDNFDTTYMRGAMSMFYDCKSIETLDLSQFTTQNALSFGKMFGNCTNLKQMDMSNFALDGNANLYRMFENCTDLQTITLPKEFDGEISCDLPYVYYDNNAGTYGFKLELNSRTAGHVLTLHNDHKFGGSIHQQVNPSCEEKGSIAYQTCTVCNCNFDVNTGKTLLKDGDLVIPATGHSGAYHYLGNWPTCTKSGGGYEYYCDVCNKTLEVGKEIPAIGHSYMLDTDEGDGKGYSVNFRADGTATVTFYLACSSFSDWDTYTPCNHKTQVTVTISYDVHQDATCDEDEFFSFDSLIDEQTLADAILLQDGEDDVGDGIYGFNGLTVRDTVTGAEATGHVLKKVAEIPATCLSYGSTAGVVCSVCGYSENILPTEPIGHKMERQQALAPTCTTAGHGVGDVCVRCGELGAGVTYVAPLGHDFSEEVAAELPTCTKVGHTAGKKCTRCNAVEGCELIDDLGHTEEVLQGKAPTETESGLTDGLRCSVCGEILREQQVIPPLNSDKKGKLGALEWSLIGLSSALAASAAVVVAIVAIKKKRG